VLVLVLAGEGSVVIAEAVDARVSEDGESIASGRAAIGSIEARLALATSVAASSTRGTTTVVGAVGLVASDSSPTAGAVAGSVEAIALVVLPVALRGAGGRAELKLEASAGGASGPVVSVPEESHGVARGEDHWGNVLTVEPDEVGRVDSGSILHQEEVEVVGADVAPGVKVVEVDGNLRTVVGRVGKNPPDAILRMSVVCSTSVISDDAIGRILQY